MGLDWVPLSKPKPTKEKFFYEVLNILEHEEEQEKSPFVELRSKSRDELIAFLNDPEICDSAYHTLQAPQLGIDEITRPWAEKKFLDADDEQKKGRTLEEFIEDNKGRTGRYSEIRI